MSNTTTDSQTVFQSGEEPTLKQVFVLIDETHRSMLRLEEKLDERVHGISTERTMYSVQEAAKILGKKPWTVRNKCNLGRINAEKSGTGGGSNAQWRISREEIARIMDEGWLPPK